MKILPLRPVSKFDVFHNFVKIISKFEKQPAKTPKITVVTGFNADKRGYLA